MIRILLTMITSRSALLVILDLNKSKMTAVPKKKTVKGHTSKQLSQNISKQEAFQYLLPTVQGLIQIRGVQIYVPLVASYPRVHVSAN